MRCMPKVYIKITTVLLHVIREIKTQSQHGIEYYHISLKLTIA